MKAKRFIISGGGTGGHIYPAIAIAIAIQKQWSDAEILFVGAEGRMEMEKVPQAGYEIVGLPIAGIQRKLDWRNVVLPFKVIRSLWKARGVIRKFQPDAVIGVGGYASGPLLWMAGLMGLPTFIQEQNSFAGLTNKWLSKKATKIMVAYPEMERFFPADKIIVTGNPIRFEWHASAYSKSDALRHFGLNEDHPVLLMVGGSLGARAMNQVMEAHLEELLNKGYQVIWQTGKNYQPNAQWSGKRGLWVGPFINEMHQAYTAADAIVSRAGAMSISELSLVGKPTAFVPSPYVSEDHQTHNAMALVKDGAALMIKESELKEQWMGVIDELMKKSAENEHRCHQLLRWAKPSASIDIANIISKNI